MNNDEFLSYVQEFWCWDEEWYAGRADLIEAENSAEAAERWVAEHWWSMEQPDEVRMHVRTPEGIVFAFDVFSEIDVSFYTMPVSR